MLETLEAIYTRRSVRSFDSSKFVEEDKINAILKAGLCAPSAMNEQPWHLILVEDRQILNNIAKHYQYAKMCFSSNHAIIPCADIDKDKIHGEFWIQDMSACIENMLIAIRGLELSAVWVGIHSCKCGMQQYIADILKLPENILPFCIIPFGYSGDGIIQKEKTIFPKDRIHRNGFEEIINIT